MVTGRAGDEHSPAGDYEGPRPKASPGRVEIQGPGGGRQRGYPVRHRQLCVRFLGLPQPELDARFLSDILSEEIGRVRPGQIVEISGKALEGRTIQGRVKRIYPAGFKKISALGVEQQRVKVIVSFDNNGLGLRPYVSVDIRIIVAEHKGVLTVPERAVFRSGDGWAVMVIEKGRLAVRPIEIGLRNDRLVEVTGGLSRDDVVVLEPTNSLRPGVRARPK